MTATEARTGRGFLQVNVVNIENNFPVQNAKISVSRTDAPLRPLEQADTDRSGQTPEISLEAPPVEYSLDPESGIRPYAEYNLEITAPGFKTVRLNGLRFWRFRCHSPGSDGAGNRSCCRKSCRNSRSHPLRLLILRKLQSRKFSL